MKSQKVLQAKRFAETKILELAISRFARGFGMAIALMIAVSLLVSGRLAFAAPPKVTLGTQLTKVTDGTSPFPSVDPNGSNGLVATLDAAQYTFDVNVNPVDGIAGTVTNLTIVGTIDTTTTEVSWLRNSANIANISDVCNTRTVSVDGKTMTCIVNGPIATSTTLNIQAAWFATSAAANGTDVTVSFTASATDPSAADDPLPATSNDDTLQVVSDGSATYEVRKANGAARVESSQRDPDTGAPLYVDVDWHFQVEVTPQSGNMKGLSTVGLSDISFTDNLSAPADTTQIPLSSKGTLVSCGASNTNYVAASSGGNANDNVPSSGSWNCSQAGGTGTDVSVTATGIDWAPLWYPDRWGPAISPNSTADSYFRFGVVNTANEQYGSPSGKNAHAVVATQRMTLRYPYNDVKAFNQTAGDKDATTTAISWCNELTNVDMTDGPHGVDDSANNVACSPAFGIASGTGVDTGKGFLRGQNSSISLSETPGRDIALKRGTYGPSANEQYVQPNQNFRVRYSVQSATSSVEGLSNMVGCDTIENTQYTLRAHSATTLSGYTTGGTHSYYSWHYKSGAAGFPAITDSDVVVEFANAGAFNTNADQRDYNCDNGSLDWQTDPTQVSGGLSAVNLVRTRIINDKQIAPGAEIMTIFSAKAAGDVVPGDKLRNFYTYKFDVGSTAGSYNRATNSCDLESNTWGGSSGSICKNLGDRLYVLGASGNLQVRDAGNNDPNDWIINKAVGSQWTYTMYAGMSNMTDVNISNVEVYQLVEPGTEYISSTLQPDLIVQDCNANTNPTCLTTPAARTNIGYTTLKWNLGNYSFTNPTPGTIHTDYTAFGQWDVTIQISPFIANGSIVANRGWVQADGLENLSSPVNFPACPVANDFDTYSGPLDEDCVNVTNPNVFAIEKYVVEDQPPYNDRQAEIPLDGTVKYNLAYANTAGSAKVMDAIDVLPYNGDGRFPNSVIDGGYTVSKVEATTNPGLLSQIYITGDDPATIDSDPNDAGNTAVGVNGRWKCTYAQRGTVGCPAEDAITGLRFISNSIVSGQFGFIRVELTTTNNDGEEFYTNNFQARATGMALPVTSSDVTAVTPACLSVGNLVFNDVNKNGKFDDGDTGFNNVSIELVKNSDDSVYKTTTSGSDGRWEINCVAPGDYYVRLTATNFDDGAPLQGYEPAPGATDTPTGIDEQDSHDLLNSSGIFRSGVFTLNYATGPTGESGNHFGTDPNDDLTIDLGLVLSATDTPDPDPQPETPPSTNGSSNMQSLLATTGDVVSLLFVLSLVASVIWMHYLHGKPNYRLRR